MAAFPIAPASSRYLWFFIPVTALPGYQAGWFRLQDGERALLYLTDRSRAVYVPTTMGYCLLLSPLDPDGFLAALQGHHG